MDMNYIDKVNILKITITNFDYENDHKVTLFSNQDESSFYTSDISYLKSIGKTQNQINKGVRIEVIGCATFNIFNNTFLIGGIFTIYKINQKLNYEHLIPESEIEIYYFKNEIINFQPQKLNKETIYENPILMNVNSSLTLIIPKAISNDKPSILNLNIRIEKQINNSNQLVGLHPVNCYKKEKMLLF